jgi:RimJ/RimL family protein N-acetyltransferase
MPTEDEYFIRRFEPDDAASFVAAVHASLPGLAEAMPWCKPDYALADAVAWIAFTQQAWASGTEFPLGIFERASRCVVGGVGINQINKAHSICNLGYWVSAPHSKRGVARFAARAAARLAVGEIGLSRVEIVTRVDNQASRRVAEAVGARFECIARNRLRVGGKSEEAAVYSLTPEDVRAWTGG